MDLSDTEHALAVKDRGMSLPPSFFSAREMIWVTPLNRRQGVFMVINNSDRMEIADRVSEWRESAGAPADFLTVIMYEHIAGNDGKRGPAC